MKKILFPALGLLLGLSATHTAHAQVNFIRLGINAATLASRAANKNDANAVPMSTYQGQSFPMVRTPAKELPKKSGPKITALETELDRCHTALLASPSVSIYTPEQLSALQTAMRNLATVKSENIASYQQEAAFYVAENTRRQQADAPAK